MDWSGRIGYAAIALALPLLGVACRSGSNHQTDEATSGHQKVALERTYREIAGAYELRIPNTPQAQMRLEIRPDGRWAMVNTESGFWGTWSETKGAFSFVGTDGPAGKTVNPPPERVVYDRRSVVIVNPGDGEWTFHRVGGPFVISFIDTSLETEKDRLEHPKIAGPSTYAQIRALHDRKGDKPDLVKGK